MNKIENKEFWFCFGQTKSKQKSEQNQNKIRTKSEQNQNKIKQNQNKIQRIF